MSSADDAYASFLDKANQDTGAAQPPPVTTSASASSHTGRVHPALSGLQDQYYMSETDEPFVPVSLPWEGSGSPSEADFASLLDLDAPVSKCAVAEFDPRNRYATVVDAVGRAGDGTVYVFRVDLDGARVEYYVVSVSRKESAVVGVKAMAVES